jgi:hypothetical protein
MKDPEAGGCHGGTAQVSHNNHFVPKWYLKRWADSGGLIWSYSLLVPHADVDVWSQRHVTAVAYRRDLYTSNRDGEDGDDFERWITAEFEEPAQGAVAKAVSGRKLTQDDFRRLVFFAACQDLRTPQNYAESMGRWREEYPELLAGILKEAVGKIEAAHRAGGTLPPGPPADSGLSDAFKINVHPNAYPETGQGAIDVSMLVGRDLWLKEQRYVLQGIAKRFVDHSWCIAEAAKGIEWFTSDHPVVKLNWHGDGTWDVKGGWGSQRGNICVPLSRRHLLFTEIGAEMPPRMRFNRSQTKAIRQAVAARAWRSIFALQQVPDVEHLHPRIVDPDACKSEREQWERFHGGQSEAERHYRVGEAPALPDADAITSGAPVIRITEM